MKLLVALMIVSLIPVTGFAKRFANQYSEFELPTGWECALEGSEWVCQSSNKNRQKEAIIILAAKIRGEQDSLDQYLAYLKSTKTYSLPGGKSQVSEAKYSKIRPVNAHRWVDSLHLASEVPGFYTRYLATVKEDLGVAVTFSVSKEHYASYQPIFDKIVASLRVFRQKKVDLSKYALKKKDEDLLGDSTFIPDDMAKHDIAVGQRKGRRRSSGGSDMTLYLVIGAAAVAFILYKKKKGKKGGKKVKKKKK
jgi:hypothetical protein